MEEKLLREKLNKKIIKNTVIYAAVSWFFTNGLSYVFESDVRDLLKTETAMTKEKVVTRDTTYTNNLGYGVDTKDSYIKVTTSWKKDEDGLYRRNIVDYYVNEEDIENIINSDNNILEMLMSKESSRAEQVKEFLTQQELDNNEPTIEGYSYYIDENDKLVKYAFDNRSIYAMYQLSDVFLGVLLAILYSEITSKEIDNASSDIILQGEGDLKKTKRLIKAKRKEEKQKKRDRQKYMNS